MKKTIKIVALMLFALYTVFGLAGCNQPTANESKSSEKVKNAVAGDYYLDLTELGMKLTVYLRLDDAGAFTFSNTLSFETVKSAGSYQFSDGGYLMVFTNVNGEEKSISDGLNSGFTVQTDGSLDFSGYGIVPYGSASISTSVDDDSSVKLIAYPVTENFVAPSTESAFQPGFYTCAAITEGDVEYHHTASFFEDNTYLIFTRYEEDGKLCLAYETGNYGVSTSQLALEPGESEHSERIQCEIVDGASLKLSILPHPAATERTIIDFAKQESVEPIADLVGVGSIGGSVVTFDVTFTLYQDGSYVAVADGHEEKGMIAIDTSAQTAKQYPDHPATSVRGISQVATVPYAQCGYSEDGRLTLTDLRVCTSENLTRFKATVAAE